MGTISNSAFACGMSRSLKGIEYANTIPIPVAQRSMYDATLIQFAAAVAQTRLTDCTITFVQFSLHAMLSCHDKPYLRSVARVHLLHSSPRRSSAPYICSTVSKQKQALMACMCARGPVEEGSPCSCAAARRCSNKFQLLRQL